MMHGGITNGGLGAHGKDMEGALFAGVESN